MVNGATVSATSPSCSKSITFTAPPPAVYSCTSLDLSAISSKPHSVQITITYTAENGATFQGATLDWGDSTTSTTSTASATHDYSDYGTYTVTAQATFEVNGVTQTVGGPNCTQSITFNAPTFVCSDLTLSPESNEPHSVVANADYTAQNGAEFENFTYNWGDNSAATTTPNNSATHDYSDYGSYNVTVSATFSVNGSDQTVTSANCANAITFTAPSTPASPTPLPPTSLVNTGPGAVGLVGIVSTVLGVIGYRFIAIRRLSKR